MTRRAVVVVVVLVCVAVGVEHLAAAPVPKHLMPKDPTFNYPGVGATWVYESPGGGELTIRIAKVEEKEGGVKLITTEFVEANGSRPHMVLSVSSAGVFLVAEGGSTYPTPWCIFKLPHKEGNTWKTEGHGGDMTAGPMEKVKVPAGEITAARVDWDLGGQGGKPTRYWYADGIGLVKMEGGIFGGLKSFTRGKE